MDSSKIYKIILLMGQSNAVGRDTDPANLTGGYIGYSDEYSEVKTAQQLACPSDDGVAACSREWPAQDTIDRIRSQGEFGPEIGIAKAIPNIKSHAQPGNIVIVKCATGGTDLASHWDETAATGYVLYSRMKSFLEDPGQLWASSYEVVGAIWIQGEADAVVEANSLAYEANLNSFIAQLRTDVSQASLPFIISRLHTGYTGGIYHATIRAAQDAVAAADAYVTTVTPTPALSGDAIHYTSDGYAELGETDLGPALDAFYTACA